MDSLYNEYKSHKEWTIVENAVNELVKSNDLQITTNSDHVIGLIVKKIGDSKSDVHTLYRILQELEVAKIHYKLERYRDDTIMICVTVVGARIEIDVFSDGSTETSIFKGDESVESGMDVVNEIINNNRD